MHSLGLQNTANKNIAEILNSELMQYADHFKLNSLLKSMHEKVFHKILALKISKDF